jgi:hypothetical protein
LINIPCEAKCLLGVRHDARVSALGSGREKVLFTENTGDALLGGGWWDLPWTC